MSDVATRREPTSSDLEERLSRLPRDVGGLLLTIGILGVVLPGLVGAPALIAGGLLLWPRGFRSVNAWLSRRCPTIHGKSLEQMLRYLDDLERRYPFPAPPHQPPHQERRHE